MNILSLFDGISCAYIALEKLNIPITNYYASEVDKFSIAVSKMNNPKIIHIGDVRDVDTSELPKIDLLIGGSPCQDLSNAQKGEGLKGEKSRLFYEYIRILEEVKPKYFLLENVKNKWADLMSEIVGKEHILINSSLFSAQSRPRYYWTNIKIEDLPYELHKDKIKDIKESKVPEKYFFNKEAVLEYIQNNDFDKKKIIATKEGIVKLFDLPKVVHNDNERQRRIYSVESKSPTILARADTTKIYDNGRIRKLTPLECERLQKIPDNYTSSCSDTQRYKMIGNAFSVDTIAHILKGLKYRE